MPNFTPSHVIIDHRARWPYLVGNIRQVESFAGLDCIEAEYKPSDTVRTGMWIGTDHLSIVKL